MATTTNYGWTTPDDTALVKDGAAAIRSLGTSIDTTVFNNASAGIAKTIVDAKGDLIAATAADTVARLAVGTNNQVLIADSSTATGLKWGTPASGSRTLLSTTTLSGATTTISGINQSYSSLYVVIHGVTNASNSNSFNCLPNNASTTNWIAIEGGSIRSGSNEWILTGDTNHPLLTSASNIYTLNFDSYASTTTFKTMNWNATFLDSNSSQRIISGGAGFRTNTAITSLVFRSAGGNLSTGTVLIYGVN